LARVIVATGARELGDGSDEMVRRLHADLGNVRHRSRW
jgi:hypothetical protein